MNNLWILSLHLIGEIAYVYHIYHGFITSSCIDMIYICNKQTMKLSKANHAVI